jgi:hypothetical protein
VCLVFILAHGLQGVVRRGTQPRAPTFDLGPDNPEGGSGSGRRVPNVTWAVGMKERMKQRVSRLARNSHTLKALDYVMYLLDRARSYQSNRRFVRRHPGFTVPQHPWRLMRSATRTTTRIYGRVSRTYVS